MWGTSDFFRLYGYEANAGVRKKTVWGDILRPMFGKRPFLRENEQPTLGS